MVPATFLPIVEANKEDEVVLNRVTYIYYLLRFYKDEKNKLWAPINFDSKVNTMILAYTLKLGFKIHKTNVRA